MHFSYCYCYASVLFSSPENHLQNLYVCFIRLDVKVYVDVGVVVVVVVVVVVDVDVDVLPAIN